MIVSQQLRVSPEVKKTASELMAMGLPTAIQALTAWRACLEKVYPSRQAMHLVLTGYSKWIEDAKPTLRVAFLELLSEIAPCLQELGAEGVAHIITAVNDIDRREDAETLLRHLRMYGETSGDILLSICSIACTALKRHQMAYVERLTGTVPAERIRQSRDTYRLIPTVAQLSNTCAPLGEGRWESALDLILLLADKNCSSAYWTANELPSRLRTLGKSLALVYLEDFKKLVQGNGTRVVGFGVGKLPTFYEKYGRERTRAFVEAAASAGEAYGVTAGQWFWELKTRTARDLLGA